MHVATFDRDAPHVRVRVRLFGPYGFINEVGYSVLQARRLSRLVGPGDSGSLGYVLHIDTLEVLGTRHARFEVHVHDQPRDDGIDGLLGMDWLREHVVTIDGPRGLVRVEP